MYKYLYFKLSIHADLRETGPPSTVLEIVGMPKDLLDSRRTTYLLMSTSLTGDRRPAQKM